MRLGQRTGVLPRAMQRALLRELIYSQNSPINLDFQARSSSMTSMTSLSLPLSLPLSLSFPISPSADNTCLKSSSFDPTIVKPEELGLHSPFIVSMPAPQVGFLTLPEPSFLTSSPMQSMSEYGAPLPTFPSAFPPPPPRPFDPTMFPPSTTYYNNNTPTAVPELPSQQHFSPALHYNNSLEPSAYRLPHAGLTSSNWRRSSASNSTMSAPPPPQLLPLPPPKLLMSSPAIVIGGPGHMFRCAKEQLEFDISQHRSPQQPPCTTDAMKV